MFLAGRTDVPVVLVIDDEADTRRALELLIKNWGYEAMTAETAEAGMAVLADHKPDLILVDGIMSGMNGIEFIRLLRADDATATIPVVLNTAVTDKGFSDNALEKGANEVWLKGKVSAEQIRARVEMYLSQQPLH